MPSEIRTPRNPGNLAKVRRSFGDRSEINEGRPILLHVEAAGVCNLPCRLCPRGLGRIERTGFLDGRDFRRLLRVLSDVLEEVVFSGWGEPLLHPDLPGLIANAAACGIPAALNTNGVLVGERAAELASSGLMTINISLDGAVSKVTHAYARDGTFARVVAGVEKLRRAKAERGTLVPAIHGQFLIDEDTADEISELTEWAFRIGIEHVKFKRLHETMPGQWPGGGFRPADELALLAGHALVRSNEQLDFSPRICAHPWESVFLGCGGVLSFCSWDAHQRINLGRTRDRFEDIWNGRTARTLRRWHSPDADTIGEPCLKCNRLPGYLRFEDAAGTANSVA